MNKYARSLLIGGNIWFLGEGMLGPLFAVFTERVGGDIFDITWAWATYLVATGVLYIVVGKFVDGKRDARLVMCIGYALNALFTFGYLLVDSPSDLFIVQLGLALANALATPTWDAIYAKHEDPRHAALLWGIAGGGAQIITGIAVLIGGIIVTFGSFELLFWIMGITQVVATIVQFRILRLK